LLLFEFHKLAVTGAGTASAAIIVAAMTRVTNRNGGRLVLPPVYRFGSFAVEM
jgi:hypothetical protein